MLLLPTKPPILARGTLEEPRCVLDPANRVRLLRIAAALCRSLKYRNHHENLSIYREQRARPMRRSGSSCET